MRCRQGEDLTLVVMANQYWWWQQRCLSLKMLFKNEKKPTSHFIRFDSYVFKTKKRSIKMFFKKIEKSLHPSLCV